MFLCLSIHYTLVLVFKKYKCIVFPADICQFNLIWWLSLITSHVNMKKQNGLCWHSPMDGTSGTLVACKHTHWLCVSSHMFLVWSSRYKPPQPPPDHQFSMWVPVPYAQRPRTRLVCQLVDQECIHDRSLGQLCLSFSMNILKATLQYQF